MARAPNTLSSSASAASASAAKSNDIDLTSADYIDSLLGFTGRDERETAREEKEAGSEFHISR